MFCPNCGAQLPDGSAFCGSCGQTLNSNAQQPTAPAGYMPPQYPSYSNAPAMPKSRKEYLATEASESARSKSKLILLTTIISVILIVAGVVAALNMPFFEIPVMAMAMEEANVDADISEIEDELDELEDKYKSSEDEFTDDEQEAVEKFIDSLNELVDNFSIMNINKFIDVTEEFVDELEDSIGTDEIESITEGMDEVSDIMSVMMGVIMGFFVLPLLFAVLGGTLKNTALTVVGIVFTAIAQLIFCGLLWVVLSLAVGIVQAVLCSKVNSEYRDYRMGRRAAY